MKSTTRAFAASYLLIIISAIPPMVGAQANGKARAHRQKDVPITILQTTDLHHHANGVDHVGLDVNPFTGTGVVGSYARIASYVEYVRATAGHQVILVDSGDWTMGTLYDFTLSSRPLALGFLQLMRYDCVTLGNHEFDYTPKGLAQILGSAQASFGFNTPIVATNMNLAGDADLAPFVGDSKLIQSSRIETLANGLKVGYIGLMGKNAAADSVSSPVTFTPLSSDYPAIQAIVDEMRNDEGVDIIVALSHSGTDSSGNSGEDVDLAAHVTGINVIASGHTHTPLSSAHTVMNGGWATEIVDAGAYGTNVARIDLIYHRDLKTTTLAGSMNVPMTNAGLKAVNPYLGPDPLLEAIVALTDRELNGSWVRSSSNSSRTTLPPTSRPEFISPWDLQRRTWYSTVRIRCRLPTASAISPPTPIATCRMPSLRRRLPPWAATPQTCPDTTSPRFRPRWSQRASCETSF